MDSKIRYTHVAHRSHTHRFLHENLKDVIPDAKVFRRDIEEKLESGKKFEISLCHEIELHFTV